MLSSSITFLIDFIRNESGIVLSPDKAYLIESRLSPIVKQYNIDSIDGIAKALSSGRGQEFKTAVIDAMTTNESFFFRDSKPFDLFREKIIPDILKNNFNTRKIRIWCAAASTGQEPYSLAIILDEISSLTGGFNIEILATDICNSALNRARAGQFTQFEVQRGLETTRLVKYFSKKNDLWEINNKIKSMINFKHHNLLENSSKLGTFDVIFIRNVLIYFDLNTKRKILDNLANIISPTGYVCLGGTETVLGITEKLTPCPESRGLYRKQSSPDSKTSIFTSPPQSRNLYRHG